MRKISSANQWHALLNRLGLTAELLRQPAKIDYTNWRNVRTTRLIEPVNGEVYAVNFGSNQWHTEDQWLLKALDQEKKEVRDFAFSGIHSWTPLAKKKRKNSMDKLTLSELESHRLNVGISELQAVLRGIKGRGNLTGEALENMQTLEEAVQKVDVFRCTVPVKQAKR